MKYLRSVWRLSGNISFSYISSPSSIYDFTNLRSSLILLKSVKGNTARLNLVGENIVHLDLHMWRSPENSVKDTDRNQSSQFIRLTSNSVMIIWFKLWSFNEFWLSSPVIWEWDFCIPTTSITSTIMVQISEHRDRSHHSERLRKSFHVTRPCLCQPAYECLHLTMCSLVTTSHNEV